MNNNQKGFHVLPVILAVVVLAVIGLAGYQVVSNDKDKPETATTQTKPNDDLEIKTKDDLDKVEKVLDSEDLSTDAKEAESLSSEVNAL